MIRLIWATMIIINTQKNFNIIEDIIMTNTISRLTEKDNNNGCKSKSFSKSISVEINKEIRTSGFLVEI